jgi:hypothetical protein
MNASFHLPFSVSLRGAVMAVLLAFGGAATALGADKYPIKPLPESGMAVDYVSTLETQMDQTANGQKQQVGGLAKMEGTITYRKVENGVPVAAEVSISDKSSISRSVNGQKQDLPFPLAGKKINLTRDANGQITHDAGNAVDPSTAEGLKKLLNVDTTFYPPNEVAVGDEWTPDPAKLPPEFTMNGQAKVNIKCKLLKIGELRGRPTYDISMGGNIAGSPQPGVDMQMTLGGITQIDRATGLPMQSDTIMKGSVRGQNESVEMQMKASMSYALAGGAAPVAVGPGVNPLDPKPANPLDPKPRNPLAPEQPVAPAVPASPFNGVFKNEKVTAEFTVEGSAVTGGVKLGTRNYPLTGTIADGKVAGSFEADGAKFNFVATLNGDTMEFNSEGNKYTLKKEQAAKPKNPLAQ